jgi:hypothetical protein
MHFFIGSEFSGRVPQNVKLPQAQRQIQRVVKVFTADKLVKNHRARHSMTYSAHLKSDGYFHEMAARQLEAPLAERGNRGLIKNVVPSAFEYLH